jgi:mono/diheme cytochrome c family protein
MHRSLGIAAAAALALLWFPGCRGDESLEARGRRVYTANCIACHHVNPALPGPVGPAVAGSDRSLIEARVVRGEYPPGYTPKQSTGLMVPLPYLRGEIDALAAYLAPQSSSDAAR